MSTISFSILTAKLVENGELLAAIGIVGCVLGGRLIIRWMNKQASEVVPRLPAEVADEDHTEDSNARKLKLAVNLAELKRRL